jgi:hypothetical protein
VVSVRNDQTLCWFQFKGLAKLITSAGGVSEDLLSEMHRQLNVIEYPKFLAAVVGKQIMRSQENRKAATQQCEVDWIAKHASASHQIAPILKVGLWPMQMNCVRATVGTKRSPKKR